MKTPFLAITLGMVATQAFSEMPRYDVKLHCTEIASFSGDYSEMMYDGCFDLEQAAYNNLKPRWDALNPAMKNHCNDIATFSGPGSYSMLEGCVQMEESAASSDNEFKY